MGKSGRSETTVSRPIHSWLLWAGVFWGVGVLVGMGLLAAYRAEPGKPAEPPSTWPAESRLSLDPEKLTLVMIVHPHCSCSHASIGELARLMADAGGELIAHVVFARPEGVPEGWERTGLWKRAKIIPGVRVWADEGAAEASRFGARTSGQTCVYDPEGTLCFSGGLTPSRAHEGNSIGRDAILALARGTEPATRESAAYGCSIREEDADFVLDELRGRREASDPKGDGE